MVRTIRSFAKLLYRSSMLLLGPPWVFYSTTRSFADVLYGINMTTMGVLHGSTNTSIILLTSPWVLHHTARISRILLGPL